MRFITTLALTTVLSALPVQAQPSPDTSRSAESVERCLAWTSDVWKHMWKTPLEKKRIDFINAVFCGDTQQVAAALAEIKNPQEAPDRRDLGESLINAAARGWTDIVEALLDKGVDIHYRDEGGATAAHRAAEEGRAATLRYLISRGADIEAGAPGNRPLYLAAQEGKTEAVKALIEAGAQVNAGSVNGMTALMIASFKGHTEVVRLLVQTPGIEINARNRNGETALLFASRGTGKADVVEELLASKDIDINAQDESNGSTALMNAVRGDDAGAFVDIIKRLLLVPGINLALKNRRGMTVFGEAEYWHHQDVLPILGQAPSKETPKEPSIPVESRAFDTIRQSPDTLFEGRAKN